MNIQRQSKFLGYDGLSPALKKDSDNRLDVSSTDISRIDKSGADTDIVGFYDKETSRVISRLCEVAHVTRADLALGIVPNGHSHRIQADTRNRFSDAGISIVAQLKPFSGDDNTVVRRLFAPSLSQVCALQSVDLSDREFVRKFASFDASLSREVFEWERDMTSNLAEEPGLEGRVARLKESTPTTIDTEMIEGLPLDDFISAKLSKLYNNPTIKETRETLTSVLDALIEWSDSLRRLHERGIMHYDAKPANVIIESVQAGTIDNLNAVLIDFGSSRYLEGPSHPYRDSGMVAGCSPQFTDILRIQAEYENILNDVEPSRDTHAVIITLLYTLAGIIEKSSSLDSYTISKLTCEVTDKGEVINSEALPFKSEPRRKSGRRGTPFFSKNKARNYFQKALEQAPAFLELISDLLYSLYSNSKSVEELIIDLKELQKHIQTYDFSDVLSLKQ